ncbi:MAG: mntP 1 [Firmicutes bacterium]|nr:mntP 1 [Bacillota bacterium]
MKYIILTQRHNRKRRIILEFLYVFILGIALSIDGFFTGIAYGFKGISLSLHSLFIVSFITACSTALAMYFAQQIGQFINIYLAITTGAIILITLGGINLTKEIFNKNNISYKSIIKALSSKRVNLHLDIITEPLAADIDHSNSINAAEAVLLGIALGIDNMVAIFAASLTGQLPYYTPLLIGVIQLVLITTGRWLSARIIPDKIQNNFTYLFGIILICLGIWRLM